MLSTLRNCQSEERPDKHRIRVITENNRIRVITLRQTLLKWYFATVHLCVRINTFANSLYTVYWSSSAFAVLSQAYQKLLMLPLWEICYFKQSQHFTLHVRLMTTGNKDEYILTLTRNSLKKYCYIWGLWHLATSWPSVSILFLLISIAMKSRNGTK